MKSRVGFLAYALDRAAGGIGRYTRELLDRLAHSDINVITLHAGYAAKRDGQVNLAGAGLLPGLLTVGQAEIAWAARQHKLALVHDPTGCIPLVLTGVRRVVTIHDAIPYVDPQTSTALDWLIYRFWLPLAARRMDSIITDSQQSKSDIMQFLSVKPENITVIPAAASSAYRPMRRAEIQPALARHALDFPYILYVGSIEPRKNLVRLLQAYALLKEWSSRWHLVIVGARNFWKSSPVLETVERLGFKAWVHFTGFVEEADLPALYNGADLFAFPSLYEGFGLPVLEAMACGTPVVTSNSSSLPEVAGEAALLVDPLDVEAITAAMRQVLSDPALAQELSQRGLQRAMEFTWERTARETIAVYERVLGKKAK